MSKRKLIRFGLYLINSEVRQSVDSLLIAAQLLGVALQRPIECHAASCQFTNEGSVIGSDPMAQSRLSQGGITVSISGTR
jgi:hypothetical protein